MIQKIGLLYVIIVTVILNGFFYTHDHVTNPFMIVGSSYVVNNDAPVFIHTTHHNSFDLKNNSDSSVKLVRIELQDYQGIYLGSMTVSGKPLTTRKIRAHETLNVEYPVEILEPQFQSPSQVQITYAYFGIQHQQIVPIHGTQTNQLTSSFNIFTTTNSGVSFHISFLPTILWIATLVFIYSRRDTAEPHIGWKLVGYSFMGGFHFSFNHYLIPFGILIAFFLLQPTINAKIKRYAVLCGFTFMILSFAFF